MRETWTDDKGKIHWVIASKGPLNFRYPGHANLRAFVFRRDGFKCQRCGYTAPVVPVDYDGRFMVPGCKPWLYLDHIKARRSGGTSHPHNLQVLCEPCNSQKMGETHDFRKTAR